MNTWKKKRQPTAKKLDKRPSLSGEAFGARLSYFFNRALSNIRQNAFVNIVTIGTLTFALLIFSLFLLLFVNLENAAEGWSDRVQVTAYFDHDLSRQEQADLHSRINSLPGTSKVVYVSREEAFKRFSSRLKGQETLLEGVRPEILPTSFDISLKKAFRDAGNVEMFVASLKNIAGVSEVQYGEEWVKRFNTFVNVMRLIGALLGAFLLIAVIFIISNTIRLTVYSRRDELELMSLVGATRFFIKAPFLLEGIIQGVIGAFFAIAMLFGLYELFLHNAGNFLVFNPTASGMVFLPPEYIAGILFSSVLLGFVGSLASLKRFINI